MNQALPSLPRGSLRITFTDPLSLRRNHHHWSTIGDPLCRRFPDSRWRPHIISLESRYFRWRHPYFYWKNPDFHWRPQIFIETPRLSLETPRLSLETLIFSLETPRLSLETPRLSLETPRFSLEIPRLSLETTRSSLENPRFSLETPHMAVYNTNMWVSNIREIWIFCFMLRIHRSPPKTWKRLHRWKVKKKKIGILLEVLRLFLW